MEVFAGVDWGCGSHAVCAIDVKGQVLDRFDAGHDREGLAGLVARLKRRGPPGEVPIAIERPTGLLVDQLVEAGFVVVPIHPNAVKACRPRYRALVDQLGQITRRIEHSLAELPDGRLLISFPRAGKVCAAAILAELGDVRATLPDQRSARRRSRRRARHLREREIQRRRLPLGLQQAPATGVDLLCRQLPPCQRLGGRRLRPGTRPRL